MILFLSLNVYLSRLNDVWFEVRLLFLRFGFLWAGVSKTLQLNFEAQRFREKAIFIDGLLDTFTRGSAGAVAGF